MEQPDTDSNVEELDTPAPETTSDASKDPDAQESDEDNPDTPEDDEVEEELDGAKLRGKKEVIERIKAERLMQADYTRKTQEVAEHRKAIEAQAAALREAENFQRAHVQEVATLVNIDQKLAQFAHVNWSQLAESDPATASRLHIEFTQLQGVKSQLANSLAQKQQSFQSQRQQAIAKAAEQGAAVLAREIPGWNGETAKQVRQFAVDQGFSESALDNIYDASVVKLLHKAMKFDQLMKTQAAKPKPEAQEKPVTQIKASSGKTVTDPDKLSAEDWAKWRNAQLARKNKR